MWNFVFQNLWAFFHRNTSIIIFLYSVCMKQMAQQDMGEGQLLFVFYMEDTHIRITTLYYSFFFHEQYVLHTKEEPKSIYIWKKKTPVSFQICISFWELHKSVPGLSWRFKSTSSRCAWICYQNHIKTVYSKFVLLKGSTLQAAAALYSDKNKLCRYFLILTNTKISHK